MLYDLKIFDVPGVKILKIFFHFQGFYYFFEVGKKLIYRCKIKFLDEFQRTKYI